MKNLFAAAIVGIGAFLAGSLPVAAATLYISEFPNGVSQIGSAQAQILPQAPVADQTVAIGGSSVASAAFNTNTRAVMLVCDTGCSISFGATPTATTSNLFLPPDVPAIFGVVPGQKVAVIANTSSSGGAAPVSTVGASNIATSQTSVAATATQVAAVRAGRQTLVVENTATTAVYCGASGVTTATGMLLPGVVGASLTIPTTAAVYCISATGTETVSVLETY